MFSLFFTFYRNYEQKTHCRFRLGCNQLCSKSYKFTGCRFVIKMPSILLLSELLLSYFHQTEFWGLHELNIVIKVASQKFMRNSAWNGLQLNFRELTQLPMHSIAELAPLDFLHQLTTSPVTWYEKYPQTFATECGFGEILDSFYLIYCHYLDPRRRNPI